MVATTLRPLKDISEAACSWALTETNVAKGAFQYKKIPNGKES